MSSVIIYILFIFIILILSKCNTLYYPFPISFKSPFILLIIISYVLFCAFRYNVGVDYVEYLADYLISHHYTSYESLVNKEAAWAYYTWFLSKEGIHFTIYFAIIAFIQIVLLLSAFKKYYTLLPSLMFSFIIGGYLIDFQNVIRQNIVMIIFLFIVMRCRNIRILYLLVIVFACYFIHKSSIIILLLFPLYRYNFKFLFNPRTNTILLLMCVLIGYTTDLFNVLASSNTFLSVLEESEYGVYASSNFLTLGTSKTMGLGYLLRVLVDIVITIQGCRFIKKKYIHTPFSYAYQLFFVGTCLHYLFPTSMIIGRPILYLTIFTIPILTCYIHESVKSLNYNFQLKTIINACTICSLILLFIMNHFINPEGNMAEYHFYWENINTIQN